MVSVTSRSDQNIAVFGLGASGLAAALALRTGGAAVSAWDDTADARTSAVASGVPLVDLYKSDWQAFDALVLSPGIPLDYPAPHRIVSLARDADCPVIGDIELLVEACPEATFVAVTGTNGKSTTTALIQHLVERAGRRVLAGGNLGPAALSLKNQGADGVYVLEVSSYQLELTHNASFDLAVLLNISPDHLDRHGGMDGYVRAKEKIFRTRATGRQIAVIGIDDPHSQSIADKLKQDGKWRVVPISVGTAVPGGVYVLDGRLYDAMDGVAEEPISDLRGIQTLPGEHNWQNSAASYAAARILGIQSDVLVKNLGSYPGLPHRQELVATVDGIRLVNDSKATNDEAAARALASYETIYWIAGGIAKESGLDATRPYHDRVRHAFLIGEASDRFSQELEGRVETNKYSSLEVAVREAFSLARSEASGDPVVLLSPAAASFDQFRNFESRGDAFRTIVRSIEAEAV